MDLSNSHWISTHLCSLSLICLLSLSFNVFISFKSSSLNVISVMFQSLLLIVWSFSWILLSLSQIVCSWESILLLSWLFSRPRLSSYSFVSLAFYAVLWDDSWSKTCKCSLASSFSLIRVLFLVCSFSISLTVWILVERAMMTFCKWSTSTSF